LNIVDIELVIIVLRGCAPLLLQYVLEGSEHVGSQSLATESLKFKYLM